MFRYQYVWDLMGTPDTHEIKTASRYMFLCSSIPSTVRLGGGCQDTKVPPIRCEIFVCLFVSLLVLFDCL